VTPFERNARHDSISTLYRKNERREKKKENKRCDRQKERKKARKRCDSFISNIHFKYQIIHRSIATPEIVRARSQRAHHAAHGGTRM